MAIAGMGARGGGARQGSRMGARPRLSSLSAPRSGEGVQKIPMIAPLCDCPEVVRLDQRDVLSNVHAMPVPTVEPMVTSLSDGRRLSRVSDRLRRRASGPPLTAVSHRATPHHGLDGGVWWGTKKHHVPICVPMSLILPSEFVFVSYRTGGI